MYKMFATDRLNLVTDIFVFSCYTRLAYADVQKLKRSEIIKGVVQTGNSGSSQKGRKQTSLPEYPCFRFSQH
jgi:hypothetical protein